MVFSSQSGASSPKRFPRACDCCLAKLFFLPVGRTCTESSAYIYNFALMVYRSDNRTPDQMRPVKIEPDFISTAEGSALIEVGNTRVICTASVEEVVPTFLRNTGKGWISSEYGMLPRSTLTRTP